MSTISGVNGSSNAWAALNTQRSQHQAKMFAKVDIDVSGGVDQAELDTMLSKVSEKTGVSLGDSKEVFSKMDSNSDGNLSSDELDAGMKALAPPSSTTTMEFAQSRGIGGSGGSQDDLFAKIDTNGDGSVNKDELKALTDKIKDATGKDVSQELAKLDADGDGKLTKAEFDANSPAPPDGAKSAQGSAAVSESEGGPPPNSGGSESAKASSSYDVLDTNKDGKVSEIERLVGELKDTVSALSGNGNGTDSAGSSDAQASNTKANYTIANLAKQIYDKMAEGLGTQRGSLLSASA